MESTPPVIILPVLPPKPSDPVVRRARGRARRLARQQRPGGPLYLWDEQGAWWLAAIFALTLGLCNLLRVWLGGIPAPDLAAYHASLLAADGGFFYTTLHPAGPQFYVQFDPIVLLFKPFYWILRQYAWPLLPLSLAVAGALALPAVYRLARQRGLSPRLSLCMAGLLALNPVLHNAISSDYHPLVYAVPLLLWGWLWLNEDKLMAGCTCWVMAMLCKENVALSVATLGALLAFNERHRRLGLAWAAAGVIGFFMITGLFMPSYYEGTGEYNALKDYAWLGDSPLAIFETLFFSPLVPIDKILSSPATWELLLTLLLTLGLMPLFAPRLLLLAAPEAAYLLLSSSPNMRSIKYHHPVLLLTVLAIVAIEGLARQREKLHPLEGGWRPVLRSPRHLIFGGLIALALLASLRTLYTEGRSLPFLTQPARRGYFKAERRAAEIRQLGRLIPPTASLTLPINLLSPRYPFVSRPLVAFLPSRNFIADYILIDSRTRTWGGGQSKEADKLRQQLAQDPAFETLHKKNGLYLFKRRQPLDATYQQRAARWTGQE